MLFVFTFQLLQFSNQSDKVNNVKSNVSVCITDKVVVEWHENNYGIVYISNLLQ